MNILKNNRKKDLNLFIDKYKKDSNKKDSIKKYSNKNKLYKVIDIKVDKLEDLIQITNLYPINNKEYYNIDISILHKIKDDLISLNNMIGMKSIKNNIMDQILFYMQKLNSSSGDFMHTVIYGSPGTGKTEVAKIIGNIFSKLGILTKGTFKKVTRSDLVSGYLGQTALKTKEVIKESLGGVLFIDEAYALGNPEKRDSYSKECIDTLCEALSDYKDNLMVIIAGYEKELNESFFEYNKGLDSRFTWRYKVDNYNETDLYLIFIKKINDIEWFLSKDNNITSDWFKKNKDYFPFYGRDIETLLAKIKIAHGRRIFGKPTSERKYLTNEDIENGFSMYTKNEYINKLKTDADIKRMISNIYI
jgi:SpoVK/Ycf46/Vps4 family AAA+-type ATPase